MFSFVLGMACAASCESIDLIKIRSGSSCSNGSCGISIFAEANKSAKIEAPKKQETTSASCCKNACGIDKVKFKIFRNRCR